MSSNIVVASRALARLGEDAISSFSDDTFASEKVAQLYETTILGLLSSYDWHFARKKSVLAIDGAATPINEWRYAYLMPVADTERVGKPLLVFNSVQVGARPIQAYEIIDRWVMTNETSIVIEYLARKPESQWPGYFMRLAIEALAADFALPITENASKDEQHRAIAFGTPGQGNRGGLFKTATEADSIGNPTRTLLDDDDPIGAARFGGRR